MRKQHTLSKLTKHGLVSAYRCFSSKPLDILPVVQNGISSGKPVVALESTIITHGMPYPHNYETALEVEEIVRSQGAIPATVAILQGRIKVGLTQEDLKFLASPDTPVIKSSRRDVPIVSSQKLNGGTTVSGTLLACSLAGINIFVTGGIGGVHRDGHISWDVSADLNELGRHSIAVISSGVKSILDIGRTLEYLETQGVCVATFGQSNDFPAFYTRSSGFKSPYHVDNVTDAAKLVKSLIDLDCNSGILLGVPVPEEFELIKNEEMEKVIQKSLTSAEEHNIKGKEVTPFLLDKIKHITAGKSLETNIALIKNNALVGSQIAVELSKLSTPSHKLITPKETAKTGDLKNEKVVCSANPVVGSAPLTMASEQQVVVVGGSMVDIVVKAEEDLKTDGRTIRGKVRELNGGVGRNLADAIGRLIQVPPILVSAVGNDALGKKLLDDIPHVNKGAVLLSESNTACANVLLDKNGECVIIIGDMDIHQEITPQKVPYFENILKKSNFVVFDGNIPLETMELILRVSHQHNIPVWFEPTDITIAAKPFQIKNLWKNITFISPNLYELLEISKTLNKGKQQNFDVFDFASLNEDEIIKKAVEHALPLASFLPTIMVTIGVHGVLLLTRNSQDSIIRIHHYKAQYISKIVNVSGAGDSLAAGFIAGLLRGHSESEAIAAGLNAASLALQSENTVSKSLVWKTPAEGAEFAALRVCS